MPTISATATAERVLVDGRNLSLTGVATGLEPLQIARRLPPFSALFVIEPDVRLIRLALHLYDYAPDLIAGRIVFLVGDDVPAAFAQFFHDHPTYEFPTSLLPTPRAESDAPARFACLQREVERAAALVTGRQAELMESTARRLAGRAAASAHDRPCRLAVLSTDPRVTAIDHARRIGRALQAGGFAHEVCVPDGPEQCHVLARLAAVERSQADAVLLVNAAAGPLATLLPANVRVASWFLPGASIAPTVAGEITPGQRIFSAGAATREALAAAGVAPGRLETLDVGADAVEGDLAAMQDVDPSASADPVDIAVAADLPSSDPSAWGLTLPSHAQLWKAMMRAVADDVDGFTAAAAESFFRRAEQASGVAISDESMRVRFITLLRDVVAPIQCARTAASALGGAGRRLGVWGAGWEALPSTDDVRRGPLPHGEPLRPILRRVRVVVLPTGQEAAIRLALDALAAGCAVCMRMTADEIAASAPSLVELVQHLNLYRTRADLVSLVHRLSATAPADRLAVARLVVRDHSVAARLDTLVTKLAAPRTQQEPARVVRL